MVIKKTIPLRENPPVLPIKGCQATTGTKPHRPVFAARNTVDDIAAQTVCGREVLPFRAVEAGHPTTPGTCPYLVLGVDQQGKDIVGIVGRLALRHYTEIMARTGTQSGVCADRQVVFIAGTQAIIVCPGIPLAAVEHIDATLGADPDIVLGINAQAIHPFVDQLGKIGGKFPGLGGKMTQSGPGTDPDVPLGVFDKGVNPVIR